MITTIPPKIPFPNEMGRDMQQYLTKNFSAALSQQQLPSCDFINNTRGEYVLALSRPDTAKPTICKYLCCLKVIEIKLGSFQSSFEYQQDAFGDKKKKVKNTSIGFEKACVYWNLASASSHESISTEKTEEGYTKRVRLLKHASLWLERLETHLHQSSIPQNLADMNDGIITLFKNLLMTQAKEGFCQLASLKKMPNQVVAGFFYEVGLLYKNCFDLLASCSLKLNKFLRYRMDYGQHYCFAMCQLNQSVYLRSVLKYDEVTANEEGAIKHLEECDKLINPKTMKDYGSKEYFGFVFASADGEREGILSDLTKQRPIAAEDRRDCERVYYKPIPPIADCEKPPKKEINFPVLSDEDLEKQTGVFISPTSDQAPTPVGEQPSLPIALFASLVQADVLRYSEDYKRDVEGIVGKLYSDSDQVRNLRSTIIEQAGVVESRTHANNIVNNTSPVLLNPTAVQSATNIRQKGGFQYLQNQYNQLTALRSSVNQTMQQQTQVVQTTFTNPALRNPYPGSAQATQVKSLEQLTVEGTTYSDSIIAATRIDDNIYAKLHEVKPTLDAAYSTPFTPTDPGSTRNLIAAVLSGEGGGNAMQAPSSNLTQQISEKLASLTYALNNYQQAEDEYHKQVAQVHDLVSSINILSVLSNRGGNLQSVVEGEKAKITAKIEPINALQANCVQLVREIETQHQQLKSLLGQTNSATGADQANVKLIAAGESFDAIETHLTKGMSFYNMLKNRVTDYGTRVAAIVNSVGSGGGGGGYGAPPQGGNPYQFGAPPQGGGYPPPQATYPPPQGGGYPPQGGYPPPQQQGGYPPQQGYIPGYGYGG